MNIRAIKRKIFDILNIKENKNYLPVPIKKYLNRNCPIILIDIGAYNGDFTKAIDNFCGISYGIIVEPLPYKAELLRELFSTQEYKIYQCVITDRTGLIDFEINETDYTSSIFSIKSDMPELSNITLGRKKVIQCESRILDNIVSENNLQKVDLIKVDVQGSEHLVISGSIEALKKTSMIWTEVSFKPLYEGSSVFWDIYYALNEKKFRLVDLVPAFKSSSNELLQADALFIRYDDS